MPCPANLVAWASWHAVPAHLLHPLSLSAGRAKPISHMTVIGYLADAANSGERAEHHADRRAPRPCAWWQPFGRLLQQSSLACMRCFCCRAATGLGAGGRRRCADRGGCRPHRRGCGLRSLAVLLPPTHWPPFAHQARPAACPDVCLLTCPLARRTCPVLLQPLWRTELRAWGASSVRCQQVRRCWRAAGISCWHRAPTLTHHTLLPSRLQPSMARSSWWQR